MRLAIMQPYLFPYLGYFQLVAAVEKFVLYDDVAFIKQGWINRNRILVEGEASTFTVPLFHASSFRRIEEIEVDRANRAHWQRKILAKIELAYRKAPCFDSTWPLVEDVFRAPVDRIAGLASRSIRAIASALEITTVIAESSSRYGNATLKGEERVIDICLRESATEYVNASGGRELYSSAAFSARGIALRFLQPRLVEYRQFGGPFVPHLSIIDVLMFNPRERVRELLRECDLT